MARKKIPTKHKNDRKINGLSIKLMMQMFGKTKRNSKLSVERRSEERQREKRRDEERNTQIHMATVRTMQRQSSSSGRSQLNVSHSVKKFINKMSKFIWSSFSFRRCELCDKTETVCFCFRLCVFSVLSVSLSLSLSAARAFIIFYSFHCVRTV